MPLDAATASAVQRLGNLMSSRVLILGAGAAAASVARALSCTNAEIDVLDVGATLPMAHEAAKRRLAGQEPSEWAADDLELVTLQPVAKSNSGKGLPEKRSFGSDFPFKDVGQRAGVLDSANVNTAVISGAYGGFTNVWGAQLMPFSRETFRSWPVSYDEMRDSYRSVLENVPFAAEEDDLAGMFPLIATSQPLPDVSERTRATLRRYALKRERLRAEGVTVGRARLSLDAHKCVRCGLCMTGCPYSLIYSASHTFDELQAAGRISYHGGVLAEHIAEREDEIVVSARELKTGKLHAFTADRVFVACGAIGTTRLVIGSLRLWNQPVDVAESAQFMLPFLSRHAIADPRGLPDFTLNQFNMVVDLGDGRDLSQLHFYNYNAAFPANLPNLLRHRSTERARAAILRRLTVSLGYLPSWASPTFRVVGKRVTSGLPEVEITSRTFRHMQNPFLRRVLARVVKSSAALDLWPLIPFMAMSAPGKSYHWGSTFPHSLGTCDTAWQSDKLGRVGPWRRVHLVDAAVFPDVPATTFTLTIMANAHRIATEVGREL